MSDADVPPRIRLNEVGDVILDDARQLRALAGEVPDDARRVRVLAYFHPDPA